MPEKSEGPRRSFSDEFKQEAVDLIVKQSYSFKAAADAVWFSSRSLREWHEKLAPEPCEEAASAELLREENKQLKKRFQRAEIERDILKITDRRRRFEAPAELSRGSFSAAFISARASGSNTIVTVFPLLPCARHFE
jgi:transposase